MPERPTPPGEPGTVATSDTLRERHIRVVRNLLFGLLAIVAAVLLLLLSAGLDRTTGPENLLVLVSLFLILLAFSRLHQGKLEQAAWLVVFGTQLVLAYETFDLGVLSPDVPYLFAYSIPTAIAALLLGRSALLLTGGTGLLLVAVAAIAEQRGIGGVGQGNADLNPIGALLIFAMVMSLLAFVLQRFGVELKSAHEQALAQRMELERVLKQNTELIAEISSLNKALEYRVEQRTWELRGALEQLESFANSAAHDLRSPLRTIDLYAMQLLEEYGDRLDDKGQNYLTRIRTAAQKQGTLFEDILTLARLGRGNLRPESVDLSRMAGHILAGLQALERGRRLTTTIAPDLLVRGDAGMLRSLMENLLGNAWKFTREAETARVEVGKLEREGQTVYYVRDNGVGFDMAYANKLFQPFQVLHPANEYPGAGVGLAVAWRVVSRHRGRIWADSAVGEGATFYFTLGSLDAPELHVPKETA